MKFAIKILPILKSLSLTLSYLHSAVYSSCIFSKCLKINFLWAIITNTEYNSCNQSTAPKETNKVNTSNRKVPPILRKEMLISRWKNISFRNRRSMEQKWGASTNRFRMVAKSKSWKSKLKGCDYLIR